MGFALVANHPFVDGNKRFGHAAMEVFLVLNGFEIEASVDEQNVLFSMSRQVFWIARAWLAGCRPKSFRFRNRSSVDMLWTVCA